jgi:hypothetical protein
VVYHTESCWHTGEKVRQINGVSTITYSKILRDDKKRRKRKRRASNNGAARVKDEENQGTVDKNITIDEECSDADK